MQDSVRMPSSKLKEALAAILEREGYIADFKVSDDTTRPGRTLEITMKYTPERVADASPACAGCRSRACVSTSRPTGCPAVLGGLGVAVLSTSQGLMTDREARQRRVGGEVLCYVW